MPVSGGSIGSFVSRFLIASQYAFYKQSNGSKPSMAHQCHSCQVKQPLEAYPGVEGHDVQQGSLEKTKRQISILGAPLIMDSPRDNAPQSFAYRIT